MPEPEMCSHVNGEELGWQEKHDKEGRNRKAKKGGC